MNNLAHESKDNDRTANNRIFKVKKHMNKLINRNEHEHSSLNPINLSVYRKRSSVNEDDSFTRLGKRFSETINVGGYESRSEK